MVLFVFFSCGSNKNLSDRRNLVAESARKIIKKHYKSRFNHKTFRADLKVNYKTANSTQNLKVALRIQKDQTIWMQAYFFGFPILKAIIEPERVRYYTKLTTTYFDGDFSEISERLGATLNFSMIQNLLLGEAFFKMKSRDFSASIDKQAHLLSPKEKDYLADVFFWIHPLNYKIERQEIKSVQKNRSLTINYKNYKTIQHTVIPSLVEILVKENDNDTKMSISYKHIEVDKALLFPYKLPNGYKRIEK